MKGLYLICYINIIICIISNAIVCCNGHITNGSPGIPWTIFAFICNMYCISVLYKASNNGLKK